MGVDSKGNLPGVIFSGGRAWREQRKFMIEQMSNLGMGKNHTMDEIIGQVLRNFGSLCCPLFLSTFGFPIFHP